MPRKTRKIRIEGDIAYVPLTKGYEAIIDANDVPSIDGRSWQALEYRRADGTVSHVYATHKGLRNALGQRKTIRMHRVIAGIHNEHVDHIDGNGLRNTRSNLRSASASQNQHNSRRHFDNTSGVKGASFDKRSQKWRAQIKVNGMEIYLGRFSCRTAAQIAYAKASFDFHGAFGRVS